MKYEEYVKQYGEVEFEGKKYALTEDAYCDNYKDGVRYFARAIDEEGNEYEVRWETTYQWDLSNEYDKLENMLKCEPDPDERERIKARLEEVEAEIEKIGRVCTTDELNACNWYKPVEVEQI